MLSQSFMIAVLNCSLCVQHARNWVSSEYPLDTPERTYSDVPCVSAGKYRINKLHRMYSKIVPLNSLSLHYCVCM